MISRCLGGLVQSLRASLEVRLGDEQTETGRSKQRHRRLALTSMSAAFARIIGVSTLLITLPLTFKYLGTERFGIWMTMSSLIAVLAFADLGVGNGILTAVSGAHGRGDEPDIRKYISSGFAALASLSCFLLLIAVPLCISAPWEWIFNLNSPALIAEVNDAAWVLCTCFALGITCGLVARIQSALQLGFLSNLWQIASSVATLLGTLAVIRFELGLPWLALSLLGIPLMVQLLNAAAFFGFQYQAYRPSLDFVESRCIRHLLSIGIHFLVLQLAFAIAFESDLLIITRALGATAAATYAIPEKLFSVIPLLMAILLAPLWPAYGEALARGDNAWVRSTVKTSLIGSVLIPAVIGVSLVVLFEPIVKLWLGNDERTGAPIFLLVSLAAWKVIQCWGMAVASFLNGANRHELQARLAIPMAILALLFKLFLIEKLGIAGVVLGTIVAYGAVALLPLSFKLRQVVRALPAPSSSTDTPAP